MPVFKWMDRQYLCDWYVKHRCTLPEKSIILSVICTIAYIFNTLWCLFCRSFPCLLVVCWLVGWLVGWFKFSLRLFVDSFAHVFGFFLLVSMYVCLFVCFFI